MFRVLPYILLTLLGLCVGSFLNVLIFRVPRGEEFVRTPSHCMRCGHQLKWYELIPILSYLLQRGKCRACKVPLSAQYPLVEGLNGAAWLITALLLRGDLLSTGLYCALFSILVVLALIDWRSFEIPEGLNIAIFVLGLVRLFTDLQNWKLYVIGMCSVSLVFLLLWLVTGGRGLGLGDVKLMASAGLLLGWPRTLLATLLGSLLGCIIHLIRMRFGAGRKLAFGPYLAAGIWISALFGAHIITAYLSLFM